MEDIPMFKTLTNRKLRSLDPAYLENLFNVKILDQGIERIPLKFPDINQSQCFCKKMVDNISNFKIIGRPEESQWIQCAICKNDLKDPCTSCQVQCLVIGSKVCIHEFHFHCIKNWLSTHDTCPFCNQEWLVTNEPKILVHFNNVLSYFVTENKDKDTIIKEIYNHFNTTQDKYLLTKNGAYVDVEKADLKKGTYALCTPDSHSNTNCLEINLKCGNENKKMYTKYTMTIKNLKNEVSILFNVFREHIKLFIKDIELVSDFDHLNMYNIDVTNGCEILVEKNGIVYYNVGTIDDYTIIYADCGPTDAPANPNMNIDETLRSMLTGRQSWNPYPYIDGINHNEISCLLSSLYILVKKADRIDQTINNIIAKFERYLELYKMPGFPKKALELLLRVKLSEFTDMHRTILSVTFYDLIKNMKMACPNIKLDNSILSDANILCNLLLLSLETNIINVDTSIPRTNESICAVNWDYAKRSVRTQKIFNIYSPIAISNVLPPVLTLNENLQTVVYTGKGKDVSSPATLYNPLSNSIADVNLAELGKKLSENTNLFLEDDRIFEEAIMVCIDTSNSMGSCSDFSEDKASKYNDNQAIMQQHYKIWDDMVVCKNIDNLSNDEIRKLKNAVIWFITHPNYSDWEKYYNCLRAIVSVEQSEYPEIATYISKYRHLFDKLLFKKDFIFVGGKKYSRIPNYGYDNKLETFTDGCLSIKMDTDDDIKYNIMEGDNIYDVIYFLYHNYRFHPHKYLLKKVRSNFGAIDPTTALSNLPDTIHLCWCDNRMINIKIYDGCEKKSSKCKNLGVKCGSKVKNIIYQYGKMEYDMCVVYQDLEDNGDNLYRGERLRYESIIRDDCEIFFINRPYAETKKIKRTYFSRLDIVKKLFDAFVDRSIAYSFNTAIGLMSFDDKSNHICDITAYYESFREKMDSLDTNGGTALYDCITDAANKLVSWQNVDAEKRAKAKLRIICLSDGADTNSKKYNMYTVKQLLKNKNIIFDSIVIGSEYDKKLLELSSETAGYIFSPSSIKYGLDIMELETLIISTNRKPLGKYYSPINEQSLPPILMPDKEIMQKTKENSKLPTFIPSDNFKNNNREVIIQKELRYILENPHPDIDVYVNDNDINFWKIIYKGPDSTPYANGCWLAYMRFPKDYPQTPPEMRMVTPIKHCNINNYGRICHSIFDRNYVPTVKVSLILECVYGLLLNPDVTDPLDTNLALQFYDANGEYEATIMEHTKQYAWKNRNDWREKFVYN